ncbi:MAG: hypothetical protein ACRECW_17640 [Phyllobacterium sp.]
MAKARPPRHSKPVSKPVTINLDPSDVKVVQDEAVSHKEEEASAVSETFSDADDTRRPQTADDFSSIETDARLSSEERDHLTNTQDEPDYESPSQTDEKPAEPKSFAPPPSRDGSRRVSSLGAGVAGGLMALLGAGVLQWSGIIPAPQPDLASVQQEIDEIKSSTLESGSLDASTQAALASAEQASKAALTASDAVNGEIAGIKQSLAAALDDLSKLQAAISSGAAGESGGLQTLSDRLGQIEQRIADISERPEQDGTAASAVADQIVALEAKIAEGAASSQAVAAFQSKLDALSQKVEANAGQPDIGLVIAANALKAAIDRGGAFGAELETYASVAPQSPEAEALLPFAERGVPTLLDLQARFEGASSQIIASAKKLPPDAGIVDRLAASARNLVEVRPVGMVEGAGVDAITARIEAQLRAGKLPEALAEWETLPPEAKEVSALFAADLKARLGADELISKAIASALASANPTSN